MNKIVLIILIGSIMVMNGCNSKDGKYITCAESSGEFCIQIYDPVCGEDSKTHSNSCEACKKVNKYKPGEC